jgi:hypothetical protein
VRAAQAGENYVQFNPSDLGAWDYLIRGKAQLADSLLEQGRARDSIGMLRATVALENDRRRPSSLGPQMNWTWYQLAWREAQAGQRAAAEKSLNEGARATGELIAQVPAGSPRRPLLALSENGWRARLQLLFGEDQSAFESATATIGRIEQIELPADDLNARGIRDNFLRHTLATAAVAAIRLGRYAQAESASRRRLGLPPNPFSGADPQDERSRASVMLAHAIAKQGRGDEARKLVQPVLEGYRSEQKRGASGISFRRDLAYALYVSAIAESNDAAGRTQRGVALAEAVRTLDGMSAEARQLYDNRELTVWIGAARAGAGGD